MGSFKGWELEAVVPDVQLDLRNSSSWLAESTAAFYLNQMASGQILELLLRDGRVVRELAGDLQGRGHRLLKVECRSNEGLRLWLQRGLVECGAWESDGDLPG